MLSILSIPLLFVLLFGRFVVCPFLFLCLSYTFPIFLILIYFLGSLRIKVQHWLMGCEKKHFSVNCCHTEMKLLESFHEFPSKFVNPLYNGNDFTTYEDEDLEAWEFEAKRWARVLFLVVKEENHLITILTV